LAAIIIDDGVVNDDCAAFRKGSEYLAEKRLFLVKVPIVEDVTHDDDIGFRQRVLEEIASVKSHSMLQPAVSNKFLEDGFDGGEVETDTVEVGMGAGKSGGNHALSRAKIHERLVILPWELAAIAWAAPALIPLIALKNPRNRSGSAYTAAKTFSSPPFPSFCNLPVRTASVSDPQKR
jgi:hypothetical protein